MRTYDELLEENARLRAEIGRQTQRIEEIERVLDELCRTGKRQAAPFSRGAPRSRPQKPGCKPGEKYGRQALRPVPSQADETFDVGCPLYCPDCSGKSSWSLRSASSRSTSLGCVRRIRRLCSMWGAVAARFGGRHPQQVSEALTVGRVHFDPGVLGLGAYLNKIGGLFYSKIAALLKEWAGFEVSRSALCRATQRLAKKARPSYDALISKIRGSSAVYVDIEATNWPAEHARYASRGDDPQVLRRGNRTERGADCQAIVMGILRTCHQKSVGAQAVIAAISRMPEPQPHAYFVDG